MHCEVCHKGKQARLPFTKFTDLCGPMETRSIGGAKYFLLFIDDCTRKFFVYSLQAKTEVMTKFIEFKQLVENQLERKIKVIRSDNCLEYCNKEFQQFCRKHGIQHQTSNVYTPQQNGVAERMNRTLVERAKCLLFDAELDKQYWAEAINMAAYLINRSASSVLVERTPKKSWTGVKVDLSNLQIFGSPVMVHIPKQLRVKWHPKSTKMMFVGYDANTKGYRCINRDTKKITIS